jgi:hypothetical protein
VDPAVLLAVNAGLHPDCEWWVPPNLPVLRNVGAAEWAETPSSRHGVIDVRAAADSG